MYNFCGHNCQSIIAVVLAMGSLKTTGSIQWPCQSSDLSPVENLKLNLK